MVCIAKNHIAFTSQHGNIFTSSLYYVLYIVRVEWSRVWQVYLSTTWSLDTQSNSGLILYAPWVKKGCHPNHGYNFVNSWWICKILSLLQSAVNFHKTDIRLPTTPLSMLLLYLGKLKNQKFAILMHIKHASKVTFYHPSNRCLPNVMKINVKINTMQNTNILLFVCSFSLTYWGNA